MSSQEGQSARKKEKLKMVVGYLYQFSGTGRWIILPCRGMDEKWHKAKAPHGLVKESDFD